VNTPNNDGINPVMAVVLSRKVSIGERAECIRALFELKGSHYLPNGHSVLYTCATDLTCIDALVSAKANVNAKNMVKGFWGLLNAQGDVPLIRAAELGEMKCVERLLRLGKHTCCVSLVVFLC